MLHYCDESKCKYCEDQTCIAGKVYHVGRYCTTFRRKSHGDNYREMMKTPAGICQREHGAMKRKGR